MPAVYFVLLFMEVVKTVPSLLVFLKFNKCLLILLCSSEDFLSDFSCKSFIQFLYLLHSSKTLELETLFLQSLVMIKKDNLRESVLVDYQLEMVWKSKLQDDEVVSYSEGPALILYCF